MSEPLAYFITFTTYGTWLHGRDPGSVDRQHNTFGTPVLPPDSNREAARHRQMRQSEYHLDAERRAVVLKTVLEVARHRGWRAWAVHVRSNHVHAVVSAAAKPEKVMSDFKAWASRRPRPMDAARQHEVSVDAGGGGRESRVRRGRSGRPDGGVRLAG